MTIKISPEEVRYIAHLSRIEVREDEIAGLCKDLDEVLTYVARVQEFASASEDLPHKNINVMREDVVIPTDPKPLLAQAPEREDDYYVVPAVLEND